MARYKTKRRQIHKKTRMSRRKLRTKHTKRIKNKNKKKRVSMKTVNKKRKLMRGRGRGILIRHKQYLTKKKVKLEKDFLEILNQEDFLILKIG